MKWNLVNPKTGDMIRVKAGSIWHYGIYVDDDEVIQFGKNPSIALKQSEEIEVDKIEVLKTSIDEFLNGGFLEVAVFGLKDNNHRRYKPKMIVQRARESLGQKGYSIIYNNCEHFVNKCVFGEPKCEQTENIRELIKKNLVIDVYTKAIKYDQGLNHVYPKLRDDEINNVNNNIVKQQKYQVWELLKHAFLNSFNVKIEDLHFNKKNNGKWICDNYYFSLSHSHDMLCVAVSKFKVGVDIELINAPKTEKIIDKVLNEQELNEYCSMNGKEKTDYFIKKWTQKESKFKQLDEKVFKPKQINIHNVQSMKINNNNDAYYVSVASDYLKYLNVYNL